MIPTEAACQRTIIEAARMGGWLAHHARPAQMQSGRWATPLQGDPGFPDLVLCRAPRILFVELKRRPNKATPAQTRWLDALDNGINGVEARVVWVPEEMDGLIAELIGAPRAA